MTGAHIFLTPSLYHWTWSSTLDSQRTLKRLLVKSFGEWWRSDQIPGLQSRTLCTRTTLMSSHRKEIHTNPNSPSRVSLLVVPSYLGGKGKSHLILLCLVCSQQRSRGDSCSCQPMLTASLFYPCCVPCVTHGGSHNPCRVSRASVVWTCISPTSALLPSSSLSLQVLRCAHIPAPQGPRFSSGPGALLFPHFRCVGDYLSLPSAGPRIAQSQSELPCSLPTTPYALPVNTSSLHLLLCCHVLTPSGIPYNFYCRLYSSLCLTLCSVRGMIFTCFNHLK